MEALYVCNWIEHVYWYPDKCERNLVQWTSVRSFHYLWPGRVVVSERVSLGANISRPILMEKRGGERIFFNALFLWFFFGERDITCIRTVVGPQQSHKAMLLKYAGGGGGGGEGGQKFSYSVMGVWGGGGVRFVSHVFHVFLRGGGQFFWGATNFDKPPPPPPPAVNYEHSIRKQKEYIQWMHDAHWYTVSALYTSSS